MIVKTGVNANVELVVPFNVDTQGLLLQRIKIIKLGKSRGKINKIIWEQVVFPHYVRENKAVGVDLTLSIPIYGVQYIALHDCIYEAFPENYKGHELHRWMYLWKVKRVTRNKNIHIITVSNESKNELIKYYHVDDE